MRMVTDSRPVEQPKEPDTDPLYQLYSLLRTTPNARPWRRATAPVGLDMAR